MSADSFIVIKALFGSLGGIAAILAAWLELRDRFQNAEEREQCRAVYRKRWETIQYLGLLELPEHIVKMTLETKKTLSSTLIRFTERPGFMAIIVMPAVSILGAVVLLLSFIRSYWGVSEIELLTTLMGDLSTLDKTLVILMFFLLFAATSGFCLVYAEYLKKEDEGALSVFDLLFATATFVGFIGWLKLVLAWDTRISAAVLILTIPLTVWGIMLPLLAAFRMLASEGPFEGRFREYSISFSAGVALSVSLTLIALAVGTFAEPQHAVPQTLQMLGVNTILDGVTVVATFAILEKTQTTGRRLSIPVAIVLDLSVSTVLACASLFFGVLGTTLQLTFSEVVNILVVRSPSGTTFELGPFFWAMHTTFLPTLAYLLVIALTWACRVFVMPVNAVLKRGHELDSPHWLGSEQITRGPSGRLTPRAWPKSLADRLARYQDS